MYNAMEAVDNIIDDINSDYYESCYDAIYEELCDRVENGELTIEEAELINDVAYDKYVTEFKSDMEREYAERRAREKFSRYHTRKNRNLYDGRPGESIPEKKYRNSSPEAQKLYYHDSRKSNLSKAVDDPYRSAKYNKRYKDMADGGNKEYIIKKLESSARNEGYDNLDRRNRYLKRI